MPTEVEAKFIADGPEPLLALAATPRIGGATLGPAEAADEVDRYVDTDDGRLAAARWAARLRTRDGRTQVSMKGPPESDTADAWHHRRPELEGPASEDPDPLRWPPSEARDFLTSLAGGRPLRDRVCLAQQRIERAVTTSDGARVGTLSLDRVRITAAERDLGELCIVELELDPASAHDDGVLTRLAGALEATPGLVAEPRTKLEHALDRLSRSR